uniref:Importin N-terminal domain-containing protein n=1 Tax=Rodentolepis nana TaxID=102285 RepID=A0A0R3TNP2_RODNA
LNFREDEIYDTDAINEFMSQTSLPGDGVFVVQLSPSQQAEVFGNHFISHLSEYKTKISSPISPETDRSLAISVTIEPIYLGLNLEKEVLLKALELSNSTEHNIVSLKEIISDYPGEFITFIYDEKSKFGGNFIIVTSQDLNYTLRLNETKINDESLALDIIEEADDSVTWKYPTVQLRLSQREIQKVHLAESRNRIVCKFERPCKELGVVRSLSNCEDLETNYMEVKPYENKNFSVPIMELERGVTCVNMKKDDSTNTNWKYPRNQVVQYVPRMTITEEKGSNTIASLSQTLTLGSDNIIKLVEQGIKENWLFDFLADDFVNLGVEDNSFDSKSTHTFKELSVLSDLRFVKDKAISHVEWHPTIDGLIAMSVVEKLTYDDRVDQMSKILSTPTYIVIWSVFDQTQPQLLLLAPEDIYCFSFNPTDPHIVAGGCNNGEVILWDISQFDLTDIAEKLKIPKEPPLFTFDEKEFNRVPVIQWCATSNVDASHITPITYLKWLPDHIELDSFGIVYENLEQRSLQLLTCATDGGIFVWDLRPEKCALAVDKTRDQMIMPYDVPQTFSALDAKWKPLLQINLFRPDTTPDHRPTCFSIKERQGNRSVLNLKSNHNKKIVTDGVTGRPSLIQVSPLDGISTTIICGTEEGDIVHVDWIPQKDVKTGKRQTPMPSFVSQHHDGPILFLERSSFLSDVYLCVGGFSWSLWKENVKSGPLLCSAIYTKAPTVASFYTLGGLWSPSRPAVFYIIRSDGVLEAWDLLDKTHEPVLLHSISSTALTSLDIKQEGRKQCIAVGDMNGVLKIFLVPHRLHVPGSEEKESIKAYFEREERRRDFVETRWRKREQERIQSEAENKRLAGITSAAALTEHERLHKMKRRLSKLSSHDVLLLNRFTFQIMLTEETATRILDFSQPLDIKLLDDVVTAMYKSSGNEQKLAEKILSALKEHPDSWTRVDSILEFSSSQQTKYFALQILEALIKTRWKVLARPQCEGIKKYIVGLIIQTSSNPELMDSEKTYLSKLNMILVEILKFEWPTNWPQFIQDIVGASKTNESLCQNNMVILRLLSEEVFDFSLGQMTQTKAKHMKDSMCQEFGMIFQLCQMVLENSQNASLVVVTLETLLRFMHWIPLGYIFETNLIQGLVTRFLSVPAFRNVTLKCLAEIAGVPARDYNDKVVELYVLTTNKLNEMLPLSTRIREAFDRGTTDEQNFIQILAIFYCTFLKSHGELLENRVPTSKLVDAYKYLLRISEVDDKEIFKICLEYWNYWVCELYTKATLSCRSVYSPTVAKAEYEPILSELRTILISRMARPEEVLVVENDHGEVVREFMKDTDSLNLYKTMRETLVYLTHLDHEDTEKIMLQKLKNQVNGTEWSRANLNSLCWAIGSISGSMMEDNERSFLVVVIRDLLGLCEHKRGKDNKAIVASNIMYVVGQYPRFLRAHWRFLKTVATKLFEFMHETHEGVQDMACDTFIKVSQKCRRQLLILQPGASCGFVEDIIRSADSIISDLQPQQVHTFYEAVATIISAETDRAAQNDLVEGLFRLPNGIWDEILLRIASDVRAVTDVEVVKQLCNILKTNYAACRALGNGYMVQLCRIYLDMLNVYKLLSGQINGLIATQGDQVVKQPLIRSMRAVKKTILNLLSCWIQRSHNPILVANDFLPPLLEAVATDYQQSPPISREPEVLTTMATIVNRLNENVLRSLPRILDAVFQCTLEMINKDLEDFPEHRTNFFILLQAVNTNCFQALLSLTTEKFKLILDSVIWAIKHTMRQVSETGLNILHTMLSNLAVPNSSTQQHLLRCFYIEIMQHMFAVITDRSQTGNLTLQASLLAFMFKMVEVGQITVALGGEDPNLTVAPEVNVQYVHQKLLEMLKQAFPHLQEAQLIVFIKGLFALDTDVTAFREHLRDFLVQIREITGEDLSDLYLEEREAEIAAAQLEKQRQQAEIPGLLGPAGMNDDYPPLGNSAGGIGSGMSGGVGVTASGSGAAGGMDMAD